VSKWTPAYEAYFENGIPVGKRAPVDKNGWAFPMLFKTDQAWILITEAGVYDSNAAIHLEPECYKFDKYVKLQNVNKLQISSHSKK
jgi:hypothetical protein